MFDLPLKKTVNSDKFRKPAIFFEKHGVYTFAPPGTSEYIRYWSEEMERCQYGYTADDGDYITGYFYFYLNYSRIIVVKDVSIKMRNGLTKHKKERVESFPLFWDYDRAYYDSVELAEVNGRHLAVIKARGKGYSFKGGSMLARNFYMFRDSVSYAIASETEFLTKDGLLSKAWDMMDFIDNNTAWYKKRQVKNSSTHKRASFIENINGVPVEQGYKSEIIGISLKNDPQKARGKRGKLILFEEAGKFPNLKTAWQVARPSVEQDGNAFGLMISYGTGGTTEADYTGLKDLFYEPEAYNCLPIKNIWDDGEQDRPCGFFVPQSANTEQFMDSDGNTDFEKSADFILTEREKIIANASDRTTIDRHICEQPLTPGEATLNISTNMFPKKDLIHHLATIRNSQTLRGLKQVGSLYYDKNGKVKFEQNPKLKDLTKYRLQVGDSKEGAVVIWEHPVDNPPWGLYIGGCLTPGEKVVTDKGLKNVEDVTLEDKLVNKEGELVSINALLRYDKIEEPTYKVHMSNVCRPTNYTQEHPLYLANSTGSDFEFVKAGEAKEGMWTKYPNIYNKNKGVDLQIWNNYIQPNTPKIDNPLEKEDFWWFVGHWLGDGFNNQQGRNYTIYNSFGDEIEYIDKYKKIVTILFKRKPNLKLQNGSNTHKFESKQLYLFLEDNFGKYADGKFISEWVKFIPDNLKKHLILGYLDSDGSIYKDKNYTITSFKSINRTLLNDIQDILFSLNIVSSINKSSKAGTYNINGKIGNTKDSYSIKLNQSETKKLGDLYNDDFSSRKLRKAKDIKLISKGVKNKACQISEDGKYIYIKIKTIEKSAYTGIVYNFDCETHSFICQYCTGHNCDPYDHDTSNTDSLGSVFIYKRVQGFESWYDTIVAEYTGRPDKANDFYEIVRMLLMYYGATLLYENEKQGLCTYFINKHCDYLLADTPTKIKDIIKDSNVSRGKGVHMPEKLKQWLETMIRDWLNTEYEPGKKNLTKILSEPLLEEMIAYNPKHGNFDRIISFGLTLMYDIEIQHVKVKQITDEDKMDLYLFKKPLFLNKIPNYGIK